MGSPRFSATPSSSRRVARANSIATASIPDNAFGSLGLALEAGIEAVNLTMRTSLASALPRDNFPWRFVGHIRPKPALHLFARHARGTSAIFSPTIIGPRQELASNIFRKETFGNAFRSMRMLWLRSESARSRGISLRARRTA